MADANVRDPHDGQQPERPLAPESMVMVDEWAQETLDMWCELYADAPTVADPFTPPEPAPSRPSVLPRPRPACAGVVLAMSNQTPPVRWGHLTHQDGQLVETHWLAPAVETCTPSELDRLEASIATRLKTWAARAYRPASPLRDDAP